MIRQATGWEKRFAKDLFDKGLLCRFINFKKCNKFISLLQEGQAMCVWGQHVYGDSVFSTQFCSEPKTILKCLCKNLGVYIEKNQENVLN